MFKKLTLTLFSLFLLVNISSAQESWSLEKCVNYAHQNNITVQQQEVGLKQSQLTEIANKASRHPNLNAGVGAGYNFGRNINPITNEFETSKNFNNSFGISSSVTVFNGNRINNSIKQSQFNVKAAEYDLAQLKNDIGINVANAYLNVLFAEEQLLAARNRKTLTEQQLTQVDKLINAGARPRNDRLEIIATISQNDQSIIAQENAVEIGYLNLKQLLQLDPARDLRIERPGTISISDSENPDILSLGDVYNKAILNQPFIKADENKLKSSALAEDIAKADLLPSIGASGNINTSYGKSDNPFFPNDPYFDQIDNNFRQSISLNMNVPIYNRKQVSTNIERARLDFLQTSLASEQNKQNLKTNVQNAIANAKAAKRTFQASQSTVDATKAAFDNAETRFKLGAINTFEYATAKNNYDQAEVDLIVAKYDYLFKLKIIDFYLGKQIKID